LNLIAKTAPAFEIAVCWCIEPERAGHLALDLPRALERAKP
jgi:hypothetical protein